MANGYQDGEKRRETQKKDESGRSHVRIILASLLATLKKFQFSQMIIADGWVRQSEWHRSLPVASCNFFNWQLPLFGKIGQSFFLFRLFVLIM